MRRPPDGIALLGSAACSAQTVGKRCVFDAMRVIDYLARPIGFRSATNMPASVAPGPRRRRAFLRAGGFGDVGRR